MAAALDARGLGLILDVVPNHMGVAGDTNPWWMDVLENGPSSPYAAFFDIDWAPAKAELRNKVLLPVLPDQYGQVLEARQLELELVDGAFFVRAARAPAARAPRSRTRGSSTHRLEALASASAPKTTPRSASSGASSPRSTTCPAGPRRIPARIDERLREKEVVKRRLAALVKESADIRESRRRQPPGLQRHGRRARQLRPAGLAAVRADVPARRLARGRRRGQLPALLRRQPPRRDPDGAPEVFEAAHQLVLRLVGEGKVTGLRVDHPDGLYAPGEYFRRLQEGAILPPRAAPRARSRPAPPRTRSSPHYRAAGRGRSGGGAGAAALDRRGEDPRCRDEPLPEWWPVAGTTGYDFLGSVNGLFVDRGTSRQHDGDLLALRRSHAEPWRTLSYAAKRLIMQVSMASEINAARPCTSTASRERNRLSRDFTLREPDRARCARSSRPSPSTAPTSATTATEPSARDRAYIERAIAEAKRRNPTVNASIFDFLARRAARCAIPRSDADERAPSAVTSRCASSRSRGRSRPRASRTRRSIATTGWSRSTRWAATRRASASPPAAFHDKNARRRARWPDSLLATSTHDTKRGEDVRARINVLSEMPESSGSTGPPLARDRPPIQARRRRTQPRPIANDEYLLYQTLVGAWPARRRADESPRRFTDADLRLHGEGDARRPRSTRAGSTPMPAYDAGDARTSSRGPARRTGSRVPRGVPPVPGADRPRTAWSTRSRRPLLKLAAPGIPDFYQGSELWDLSLVDPDNRRPVDFARRQTLLEDLTARIADAPATTWRALVPRALAAPGRTAASSST